MFYFRDTRYNRQEQMPEWGTERQRALKNAKVVAIGAGGVKSTLLMSLAAAGVGTIRIIEFDSVELSNLNRQILYQTSDIAKPKAQSCRDALIALNPEVSVESLNDKITENNIVELCEDFDFVVEGGDSPAGRNLVNEYCLSVGKPYTHASAQFNYGYVFSVIPSLKTACFACFFPTDHIRQEHTGPVPVSVLSTSVAGSLGAAEVLKWFMGYQESMFFNRRLCFSSLLLSSEFSIEIRERRVHCPVCSRYYNL
ncbi:MAG: ThiF family adenylyltransferase [bacterium]|nr:ThiF family adenylyltransferase [bacterium]MDZ4286069.1 ThiF family adenylyltransferase [Candidatus Sungbacteria bacterium]